MRIAQLIPRLREAAQLRYMYESNQIFDIHNCSFFPSFNILSLTLSEMPQKIKIESVLIFSSFSISCIAFLCLLRYSKMKKDKLKQRFGRRPMGFAYRHLIVLLERIPLGGTARELYPGAKGNLAEIGLGIRIDAEYAFLPFWHSRSICGISEIRYSAG